MGGNSVSIGYYSPPNPTLNPRRRDIFDRTGLGMELGKGLHGLVDSAQREGYTQPVEEFPSPVSSELHSSAIGALLVMERALDLGSKDS